MILQHLSAHHCYRFIGREIMMVVFEREEGEGGAGVFGVEVNASGQNRLLANECARKVEAAFHGEVGSSFNELSEKLSEDQLFGEIFGTDHDLIFRMGASGDRK